MRKASGAQECFCLEFILVSISIVDSTLNTRDREKVCVCVCVCVCARARARVCEGEGVCVI